jgi:hypothetical protein
VKICLVQVFSTFPSRFYPGMNTYYEIHRIEFIQAFAAYSYCSLQISYQKSIKDQVVKAKETGQTHLISVFSLYWDSNAFTLPKEKISKTGRNPWTRQIWKWFGSYSFMVGFLDGLYQAGQGMIYGSRDSQYNSFPNDSAVDEVNLGNSLS